MKKHVLFWVGIKSENKHLREKHGDFKYLDISRKCWEYWCNKNDVVFFPYENSSEKDTNAHKATWTRWFDVFDQIEEDISSKYRILSSVTYKDMPDLETFIKSIYEIDDIEFWKVKLKLDRMKEYPSSVRRICIEIEDPYFRKKISSNRLISQKVEVLKQEIREKYSSKVSNYFHDIIIHIGDNFEHTRESSKIKFND